MFSPIQPGIFPRNVADADNVVLALSDPLDDARLIGRRDTDHLTVSLVRKFTGLCSVPLKRVGVASFSLEANTSMEICSGNSIVLSEQLLVDATEVLGKGDIATTRSLNARGSKREAVKHFWRIVEDGGTWKCTGDLD